jgi:hypothetical protein
MIERPTTPDREQQKADNVASRRQSGLEPEPRDRDEAGEHRVPGDDEREEENPNALWSGVQPAAPRAYVSTFQPAGCQR